jgi:hypothetical protein
MVRVIEYDASVPRRWSSLAFLSIVVVVLVAGCYAPSSPASCQILCGAGPICPGDLQCGTDHFCHAPGEAADACQITVTVTPADTSILPATGQRFHASISGSTDTAVTWEVDADNGTIDANGVYTPPSAPGTYHVRARSHADSMQTGETSITVQGAGAATTIVDVGTMANPTGLPGQPHLVYAKEAQAWWLFYDDAAQPTFLRTRSSSSFTSWTAGADCMIGHTVDDGRDLAVTYRDLGGHDVVHISDGYQDGAPERVHIRATIGASAITFGQPVFVNGGDGGEPDGSESIVDGAGHVYDATGWLGTPMTPPLSPCGAGDAVIYKSMIVDDGTTSFDTATWEQTVLWCVQLQIHSRQLLIDDANTIYQLFDEAGGDPPSNVLMTILPEGQSWLPAQLPAGPKVVPFPAFDDSPVRLFLFGDWMAALQPGQVHVVRRLIDDGSYQHRIFDTTTMTWSDGGAIPSLPASIGSGLYLTPYGGGLLLAVIGSSLGNPIEYTYWNGATWSGWQPLVGTSAMRTGLSGASPTDHSPALIWTEGTTIAGLALP